jgi:hypothetical protein
LDFWINTEPGGAEVLLKIIFLDAEPGGAEAVFGILDKH